MSTSSACPYQHLAYPNPKNVFFADSYSKILYAMVYALYKKEFTSIVLLGSHNFLRAFFKFEDHPLFNFIPAGPALRTFLPVNQLVSLPEITKEEFSIARWLQDYDVQLHMFPPTSPVQLYSRDDIVGHYINDNHFMRVRGYLPETDNIFVYKIFSAPSYELSSKTAEDEKIEIFDWVHVLEHELSDADKSDIKYRMNVVDLHPSTKSVLFIYSEPDGVDKEAKYLLRYHTSRLLQDIAASGWEVWFKGEESGNWAPVGAPNVKILPPYVPYQFYMTNCLPDTTFTHVINFASSEPALSIGAPMIPWDTRKAMLLRNYNMTQADAVRVYKKGLLRVARALLTNQDVLRLWETWCR